MWEKPQGHLQGTSPRLQALDPAQHVQVSSRVLLDDILDVVGTQGLLELPLGHQELQDPAGTARLEAGMGCLGGFCVGWGTWEGTASPDCSDEGLHCRHDVLEGQVAGGAPLLSTVLWRAVSCGHQEWVDGTPRGLSPTLQPPHPQGLTLSRGAWLEPQGRSEPGAVVEAPAFLHLGGA